MRRLKVLMSVIILFGVVSLRSAYSQDAYPEVSSAISSKSWDFGNKSIRNDRNNTDLVDLDNFKLILYKFADGKVLLVTSFSTRVHNLPSDGVWLDFRFSRADGQPATDVKHVLRLANTCKNGSYFEQKLLDTPEIYPVITAVQYHFEGSYSAC